MAPRRPRGRGRALRAFLACPQRGPAGIRSIDPVPDASDPSASRLRALHAAAAPHLARIVDEAAAALPRAEAARCQPALARWLDGLLLGTGAEPAALAAGVAGDGPGAAARAVSVLARVRAQLAALIDDVLAGDEASRRATARALHTAIDGELLRLLEGAGAPRAGRQDAAARLSVIGQMAASIGHELRNPLSVMESSLFLARRQLAERGASDAHVEQHLEKIAVELRRSHKTIDDLLGLARNQAPRRQRVPLAGLAERALATLPPLAGVHVTVAIDAGVAVDADPDQILQVLVNLLLNAQHAVGASGHIAVAGARAGTTTLLRVRDDGPGVPAELRHRLFEPLFTTKPRGSGLGLALCRRIVDAHGGTLVLEPTAAGASFLVTLPDG